MTEAFLALPIFFPGTGLWKGYQGRCYIIKVLSVAAARSKKRMAAGHEPECLLDFWAQQVSDGAQVASRLLAIRSAHFLAWSKRRWPVR